MNLVLLFKTVLIVAILCIGGVAFFQKGDDLASIVSVVTQLIVWPDTLLYSETLTAPINSVLGVALIFGYVLAVIALLLVKSRLQIDVEPVLPSLRARPLVVFLVTLLFLAAPYLPSSSPHSSLSVRLIVEAINVSSPALFVWGIGMMLVTAGSGLYALNFVTKIFKGGK